MRTPNDLLFSMQHLWTKPTPDGAWEAGITDYAQDLLGDIVFIDAPAVGMELKTGQPCGLVESVKTGSDLHALIDGKVTEVNQSIIDMPEQINNDPYKAWIFKFEPADIEAKSTLLSAETYDALVKSL